MDIHEDVTDEHILPVASRNKADFAFAFDLKVWIPRLSLTALTHKTIFTFLQYALLEDVAGCRCNNAWLSLDGNP